MKKNVLKLILNITQAFFEEQSMIIQNTCRNNGFEEGLGCGFKQANFMQDNVFYILSRFLLIFLINNQSIIEEMIKSNQFSFNPTKKLRLNQERINLRKIQSSEFKSIEKQSEKTKNNFFQEKKAKFLKSKSKEKRLSFSSSKLFQPLCRQYSNQQKNKKQKLKIQDPKTPLKEKQNTTSYMRISREKNEKKSSTKASPDQFQTQQDDLKRLILKVCIDSSDSHHTTGHNQVLRENLKPLFRYFRSKLQTDQLLYEEYESLWKESIFKEKHNMQKGVNTQIKHLSIFSEIFSQSITFSQSYLSQYLSLSSKVQQLKKQKINLENTTFSFIEALKMKTEETQRISRAIYELDAQYEDLKCKTDIETRRNQDILMQIEQNEKFLKKSKEESLKILNFVETQQQKKILHWVSEAYKKIESDIYDFAAYLQCNAMASSLIWQPKPFRAVQQWVMKEMDRLNKYVLQSDEDIPKKCEKMVKFISDTTRKYRTKDEQMMKVMDYKTECIKKYIKMMQIWLENWQLKQQYLVNLRDQFAKESKQLNEILGNFQKQTDSQLRALDLKKTVELWRKIELNYKYGNSFY